MEPTSSNRDISYINNTSSGQGKSVFRRKTDQLRLVLQDRVTKYFRLRPDFKEWDNFRVAADAPNSAFLSIFTHRGSQSS